MEQFHLIVRLNNMNGKNSKNVNSPIRSLRAGQPVLRRFSRKLYTAYPAAHIKVMDLKVLDSAGESAGYDPYNRPPPSGE